MNPDLLQLTVQLANPSDNYRLFEPIKQSYNVVLQNKNKQLIVLKTAQEIINLDVQLRAEFSDTMKLIESPNLTKKIGKSSSTGGSHWFSKIFHKDGKKDMNTSSENTSTATTNAETGINQQEIQALLDKIAIYFQHLLMNSVISSSKEFQAFLDAQKNLKSIGNNQPAAAAYENKQITIGKAKKVGIENFNILRVIGKGCMGKVILVREKETNRLFAIKSIHKHWVIKHREVEHTISERDILVNISLMRHPFLMRMHYSFQNATELFLVLDYYPGGDLATQLGRFHKFKEERARFYARIQELHLKGVIYRDLKPENVLISNTGHIVLTDFGLSKIFTSSTYKTSTFCGTAEYLAPEVLKADEYDFAVDWWSFGTLIYEMLVGITPFWAENHNAMYQRVLHDELEFVEEIPDTAKDLIHGLLQRDPKNRLGTRSVNDIKNHPFFASTNWEDALALKMTPSYIPTIDGETDISNFEESFTMMTPCLTPTFDPISPSVQKSFLGFSFNGNAQE